MLVALVNTFADLIEFISRLADKFRNKFKARRSSLLLAAQYQCHDKDTSFIILIYRYRFNRGLPSYSNLNSSVNYHQKSILALDRR